LQTIQNIHSLINLTSLSIHRICKVSDNLIIKHHLNSGDLDIKIQILKKCKEMLTKINS